MEGEKDSVHEGEASDMEFQTLLELVEPSTLVLCVVPHQLQSVLQLL